MVLEYHMSSWAVSFITYYFVLLHKTVYRFRLNFGTILVFSYIFCRQTVCHSALSMHFTPDHYLSEFDLSDEQSELHMLIKLILTLPHPFFILRFIASLRILLDFEFQDKNQSEKKLYFFFRGNHMIHIFNAFRIII